MDIRIGESFASELAAAGLLGLPFSWATDGTFNFSDQITPDQKMAIAAVFSAHRPEIGMLKAYAASARYAREVGGIVFTGARVVTDRQSQSMIAGAAMMAQLTPAFTTSWKTADGSFITLGAAEMLQLAQAVATHVADCFRGEEAAVAGIVAQPPTITRPDQIDAIFSVIP